VNVLQPAGELTLAYEVLRAQATGARPASTPFGFALFLAAGFPAWMMAWIPLTPVVAKPPAAPDHRAPLVGLGGEVVQLLTEMALGCQRRSTS